MRDLRDLRSHRNDAEKRFQHTAYEFFATALPLPAWAFGNWLSLLRGRHLLGLTNFVCDVMPHVVEKLDSAESAAAADLFTVGASSPYPGNKSLTSGDKLNPISYAGSRKGLTKKRKQAQSLQNCL
ncbi:hypothetical protein Z517_02750 [Fonsecaea pedrosoi CBS 271.37]|uniref:Uncharacterized protein n=1 Tax=Fonsecaea pedrosoi CBS 271.37 TaxID=1442368 RepID=A0A0D2GY36_9EURO|nr:uncharacterized protein Z517_02750 [Fonsecaea pedrosoi CBS 271.37]KIW83505.1 hypothetical protein Z517_02750 [Fonsecaea pedrosoi CBS 271.37]